MLFRIFMLIKSFSCLPLNKKKDFPFKVKIHALLIFELKKKRNQVIPN